jgi:peptidoglycan hydrolase-like protein with peptidoglycan-binding domain
VLVSAAFIVAACSSSKNTSTSTTASASSTTQDPIAAAQARVDTAQANVTKANDALTTANQQFCTQAKDYITALDRYGKVFTDTKATVGDVKTAGADLAAPRDSVSSAASAVTGAQSDVATAMKELADAQAALANAKATASSVPTSATTAPPPTTTLVPPMSINRVKQAEADLASASAGITDATPLAQAATTYNSAAFALEIAWLNLVADAGCLTNAQQEQAVAQVTSYTTAVQTQLQTAGYYKGPIDGIYGPQTADAVKQLQSDNGLPATGYVDKATALALEAKVAAVGQQAAAHGMTQTAAVQTILKLTGFWPGPIDGVWTQQLTDAVKAFQTSLGVEPTGAIDAATLSAFQQAVANLKSPPTTTTPAPTSPAATSPTTTKPPATTATTTSSTTAAPAPTTTTAATTTT